MCRRFASKGDDKFAGLGWHAGRLRLPAPRRRARVDRLRHRLGHRGRRPLLRDGPRARPRRRPRRRARCSSSAAATAASRSEPRMADLRPRRRRAVDRPHRLHPPRRGRHRRRHHRPRVLGLAQRRAPGRPRRHRHRRPHLDPGRHRRAHHADHADAASATSASSATSCTSRAARSATGRWSARAPSCSTAPCVEDEASSAPARSCRATSPCPRRAMALGVPATLKLDAVAPRRATSGWACRCTVERGRTYREQLRRLD